MSQIQKVSVKCPGGNYSILIGPGLLSRIGTYAKSVLRSGSKVLIVSNAKVSGLFIQDVLKSLKAAGFKTSTHLLPQGDERDKSTEVLVKLWQAMARVPLERTSAVVALGGGVVGDISGFAASSYMRGIPVIQVPTTLLAQVDSSIGGKTAVNLPEAKNIIGAFHQPALVLSDVNALIELRQEDLSHQFAEVIKCGVIKDKKLFEILEKKLAKSFKKKNPAFLREAIARSAKVKAEVVSKDEKETKGLRMILNYGHTFGHGFESASGYKMSHGNAVALGMLCAGRLATKLGLWKEAEEKRQAKLIYALPGLKMLRNFHLSTEQILFSMQRDKKKKDGKLRFVLPVGIGKVVVKDDISQDFIREVIDEVGREKQ